MENSRLIKYLKNLKPREQTRFKKFIASPYINSDQKLLTITDYLIELIRKDKEVTREGIFGSVFPGEKFQYFKISNLLSYITKHLERFIVEDAFYEDDYKYDLELLEVSKNKQWFDLFERSHKQLESKVNKETFHNNRYFFTKFKIADEKLGYSYFLGNRKNDDSLKDKIEYLDLYYVSTMQTTLCEWFNRRNIINIKEEVDTHSDLISYVSNQKERYSEYPFITIYHLILLTLTDFDNEEHYFELRKKLISETMDFDGVETHRMYRYAQNYCIKKINSGNTKFLAELFELYNETLEAELIFENGFIAEGDFKNIVTLSLRLKKFEFTEKFVNNYSSRLPEDHEENATTYNMAQIHYAKGEYDSALQGLQHVEFTDVYYALGARVLILKTYYDLDEEEALESHIHAFKIYLSRNKLISEYQKTTHNNLIRFTKKAFSIKSKLAYTRIERLTPVLEKLYENVNSTRAISNINWIRAKLDELKEMINKK